MKRSVLIPTALALVVVTITIRGIFQTTPRSPVEILNGVQAMINAGEYDERIALRELDRVQSMAIQMGEKRIELQALSLRAEVLRELGSLEDARITLQSLLEAMPGNQRIELRLARLLSLQAKDEDALDSVRELLSADSTHAEAWLLGGILQRERAKKSHDEATQIARQSLVLEQFSGVRKWIDELCSRDPADPERPASSAKLANVLRTRNEIAFERVADLADRASEDNRAARSCFARSFDGLADPRAAEGLIDMWTATGHAVIACEFGMVSTRLAELGTNPGVARALLEALNKADRGMDLASFMARWDWDTGGGDFDFYLSACRSLYDLKAWRSLIRAADLLSKYGSNRGNDYATFFQGMALAGNERHENAIKKLETFIRSESDEPVLEARAASWMAIAKSARVLEMHRDEREALEGYDASGSPMPGEALLRLVELQIAGPHAASRIPEERWTRAMSLLPKRTEELFSEWLRLGEISASQDSRDVDEIVARLKSRRQALPTTDVGPYTLYMVGRAHLEDRRASSAVKVADKLLENYPGLLPAMDLAIEGQLNRGNLLDASHRVLERLEAVGRDSKTVEYLGQLGTQRFTPAQTLLSMRADPSRTGRLAVARFLIEEGEAERALRAIDGIRIGRKAAPEGTVEERVVAGQALLELGRHEEAAERVVGLAADPVFGVSALTVEFEAVLASGDERAMGRLIERTLAIGILSRDLYLAMIDRMLETGFGDLSRPLVEALDAQAETRGGDLFLRQALLGAVTGNREETIEGLSRAEAYLEDGTPELGRLLLAVDDHSWRLLPERVAELRAADFVATPFEEAVLAIFEERIEAGQTLAETQLDAEPERAEWALVLAAAQLLQNQDVVLPPDYGERAAIETIRLLRGSQDSVRDPRLVLGLLVALERQGWSKWAIPRLVELRTTGGAGLVWPSFLAARAHLAMGEEESANRILTALVGRAPRFEPGWDALIQMTEDEYGDPYHSRVVRLKKQRLEALAEEVRGDAMSVAIDQAASRALSGERQGAIKDLEQALAQAEAEAIDLEDAEPIVAGRDLLARLLREEGELLRAASEYGRACDALPNRSDHALVAEFTLMLNGMTRRSFETFPLSSEGSAADANPGTEAEDSTSPTVEPDPHFESSPTESTEIAPAHEDGQSNTPLSNADLSESTESQDSGAEQPQARPADLSPDNPDDSEPSEDEGSLGAGQRASLAAAEELESIDSESLLGAPEATYGEESSENETSSELDEPQGEATEAADNNASEQSSSLSATDSALAPQPAEGIRPITTAQMREATAVATLAITRLDERFPSDPLVALAKARLEIVMHPGDNAAATRAIRMLTNFRRSTDIRPLNELRKGSASAWTSFLLPRSPETAQRFVEQDLAQTPGSIELWLLYAECLTKRGLDNEAIELYEKLVAMSHDAAAHYGLAFLLAKRGADPLLVEAQLKAAETVDKKGSKARSTLIRQIAGLSSRNPKMTSILRTLETLWRSRDATVAEIDPSEIARVYTRALVENGAEGDFRQIIRLASEMVHDATGNYERDHYRALAGVSAHLERASRAAARERQREQIRDSKAAKDSAESADKPPAPSAETVKKP